MSEREIRLLREDIQKNIKSMNDAADIMATQRRQLAEAEGERDRLREAGLNIINWMVEHQQADGVCIACDYEFDTDGKHSEDCVFGAVAKAALEAAEAGDV